MMKLVGIYFLCAVANCDAGVIIDESSAPPTALRIGENRVSYSQRYDDWLESIPETDRAWSIIKSVYDDMAVVQLGSVEAAETYTDWLPDLELLETHPEFVDRLHQITMFPSLGMPTTELGVDADDDPEETEILLGLLLPHVSVLRDSAILLAMDAQEADEAERVLKDLRSIQWIIQHHSVADTLIEGTVIVRLESMMSGLVLDNGLEIDGWDRRSLDELSSIYDKTLASEPATRFIQSERALQENFLDWIYVDSNGMQLSNRGAKRLLSIAEQDEPRKMMIQIASESVHPRAEQEQNFEQFTQAARADLSTPIYNTRSLLTTEAEESLAQLSYQSKLSFLPVGLIVPAYGKFVSLAHEGRAYRDAARLKIATYQHRDRHGAWPDSTAAIDDDLLDRIPIDPYTGDPLRLRIEEGRVVIYSVGPDRDDDQGREIRAHRFVLRDEYEGFDEDQLERWDGDWVLTQDP
tara:strand:+ start:2053 stop:3450 length:1398 start_codon:yes stop_codon:yes gene_type:complete